MGGWIGDSSRGRILLAVALLGLLVLLILGGGAARASACDTWQGRAHGDWSTAANWSGGVPNSNTDACIPGTGSGPVLISGESAQAHSLTLSGAELDIEGTPGTPGTLTLASDSSIGSGSSIVLESSCTTSCTNRVTARLTISSGTLTNNGTIQPEFELGDPNARVLDGNIVNASSGTINVQAPLEYGAGFLGGTLDNQGTIRIASGQSFTVPDGGSSTVINDAGGQITNGNSSGVLDIGPQNTFNQGGGTTVPATASPADPAVVVDGSNLGSTLKYTGTGAGTIEAQNLVTLSGSLGPGQNLVVQGVSSAGCPESLVTSPGGFANAGTITLAGPCDSGVKISSGTLTNTGTIVTKPGAASRELKGNMTTSGTLNITGATAFDGSGATLTQTAGTTTISPDQFVDMTGSNGTFELKGGLLQSPGSNSSHQGSITGSLNNSGGIVAPGTTTAPGDFTITGHYTQSSGGTLAAVLAGTQVGTSYSQLGVTGGSTLGGTLEIVTHSGFSPQPGNLFTVLGGSSDSGKFGKLVGEFPASVPIGYKPLYDATDMTLEASRTARLTLNETGSGTVTSSPSGINCGTMCTALFFKPQAVTLTEHPASGHKFKGWSGACSGRTTTCKVRMTKAQTVTATFS